MATLRACASGTFSNHRRVEAAAIVNDWFRAADAVDGCSIKGMELIVGTREKIRFLVTVAVSNGADDRCSRARLEVGTDVENVANATSGWLVEHPSTCRSIAVSTKIEAHRQRVIDLLENIDRRRKDFMSQMGG